MQVEKFLKKKKVVLLIRELRVFHFATFHLCYFSTSILVAICIVRQCNVSGAESIQRRENSNWNFASKSSQLCLL